MFYVGVYLVLWTGYYFVLCYFNRKQSAEWVSRIVALTHAFVIARGIEVCIFTGPWPFDNFGAENTVCQNIVLEVSSAYFIFETCWCVYMQTEGIMMILHHSISVSAMLGSMWMNKSGAEVTLTTWGSELTNPFLQVRWFLRENGSYNTKFSFFNDFIFFTVFFIVRVCIGSVVACYLYWSKHTAYVMKFCGFSFFVISLLWMYQIYLFAVKRIKRLKQS